MKTVETKQVIDLLYCRKSEEAEDRQVESIPDQIKTLNEIPKESRTKDTKVYKEARSAKAPGRPDFNEMVEFIELNEDFTIRILCWKINRLFRNPKDEGTIRWLLASGKIDKIVTPSKTYLEADSDFTLAVEGAQAQRFIRDLRDDTKRGLRSKLKKGVFPGLAPVGYINNKWKDQGKRDISPHPDYFSLMRKVFEIALTGNFSLEGLAKEAEKLGVKNSRNKYVSKSQMGDILHNPFYTGKYYMYSKKLHDNGVHEAMITIEEYNLLQDILAGKSRPRKQTHDFWHTGIPIVCGGCRCCSITGQERTRYYKNGTTQLFAYARCTKKCKHSKCTQPYLPIGELEKQVLELLGTITIPTEFVDWAIKWLNEANKDQKKVRDDRQTSLERAYKQVLGKIDNLLELKISPLNKDGSLISDEEFAQKKDELIGEKNRINEQKQGVNKHVEDWTELAAKTFDFASTAHERFEKGGIEDRKLILKAIGSHLELKDKRLTIQVRKPFQFIQEVQNEISTEKWLAPTDNVKNLGKRGDLGAKNANWGE